MDSFLEEMGHRLLARRKQLRLTQEEVAEKAGVNSQMISTAETGRKALRPQNIEKICSALEISTDYLLRGVIGTSELDHLTQKLVELEPEEYRLLEDIIDSYLAAIRLQKEKTKKG